MVILYLIVVAWLIWFVYGIYSAASIELNKKAKIVLLITIVIVCCCIFIGIATDPKDPRVHVSSYTRSDGTEVKSYSRRYPNRKDEASPYLWLLIAISVSAIVLTIFLCKKLNQSDRKNEYNKEERNIIKAEFCLEQQQKKEIQYQHQFKCEWFNSVLNDCKELNISASVIDIHELIDLNSIQKIKEKYEYYGLDNISHLRIWKKEGTVYLWYCFYRKGNVKNNFTFSANPNNSYGKKSFSYFCDFLQTIYLSDKFIFMSSFDFRDICKLTNSNQIKYFESKTRTQQPEEEITVSDELTNSFIIKILPHNYENNYNFLESFTPSRYSFIAIDMDVNYYQIPLLKRKKYEQFREKVKGKKTLGKIKGLTIFYEVSD